MRSAGFLRRLFLVIAIVSLFSCTYDNLTTTPKCLLIGVAGSSGSATYNYDASGKLFSGGAGSNQWTVKYDPKGNISQLTAGGHVNFYYDSKNNLIKREEYLTIIRNGLDSEEVLESMTEFNYNSSSQLVRVANYESKNGQLTLFGIDSLGYSNSASKNLKTISFYSQSSSWTATMEYDNMHNPYADAKEMRIFNSPFFPENNITKSTTTVGGMVTVTTYTYVYNDKGFPISATQDNQGTVQTTNYTYNYR